MIGNVATTFRGNSNFGNTSFAEDNNSRRFRSSNKFKDDKEYDSFSKQSQIFDDDVNWRSMKIEQKVPSTDMGDQNWRSQLTQSIQKENKGITKKYCNFYQDLDCDFSTLRSLQQINQSQNSFDFGRQNRSTNREIALDDLNWRTPENCVLTKTLSENPPTPGKYLPPTLRKMLEQSLEERKPLNNKITENSKCSSEISEQPLENMHQQVEKIVPLITNSNTTQLSLNNSSLNQVNIPSSKLVDSEIINKLTESEVQKNKSLHDNNNTINETSRSQFKTNFGDNFSKINSQLEKVSLNDPNSDTTNQNIQVDPYNHDPGFTVTFASLCEQNIDNNNELLNYINSLPQEKTNNIVLTLIIIAIITKKIAMNATSLDDSKEIFSQIVQPLKLLIQVN